MDIQKFIEQTGDLPTLPTVAARISAEMEAESLTAKSLSFILSEDPALCAKLLRLSNSAFYGMSKQITSIEKAIMILGFNTVRSLALSVSIYSLFNEGQKSVIDVQGLWNHSLGVAVSCKLLLARNNKQFADEAFLFGVIHDIGKVVFINNDLPKMEEVGRLVAHDGLSQSEAENKIFGFDHIQLGAALLTEWKFPESIIAGVKMHHDLPPDTGDMDPDIAQMVMAVCISNQMAKALSLGLSTDTKIEPIPNDMWPFFAIQRTELPVLGQEIKDSYNNLLTAWKNF